MGQQQQLLKCLNLLESNKSDHSLKNRYADHVLISLHSGRLGCSSAGSFEAKPQPTFFHLNKLWTDCEKFFNFVVCSLSRNECLNLRDHICTVERQSICNINSYMLEVSLIGWTLCCQKETFVNETGCKANTSFYWIAYMNAIPMF